MVRSRRFLRRLWSDMMHSVLVRSLVLYSSLALVLPPGWCCRVARADSPRGAATACCGCTHCHPAEKPTSGRKPPPDKPYKCPCFDRHATSPDSPNSSAAAAIIPSPTSAVALPSDFDGPCRGQTADRFTDSPLYLLHCTFLC